MRGVHFLALLTLTWLPASVRVSASDLPFTPITPEPSTCDAEPVDIDRLAELAAVSGEEPRLYAPSESVEAPPELVDELVDVIAAAVACTNANQPLRALSFFTEDFLLHRISDEPAVTLGHLAAASTRNAEIAPVEDRLTIDRIVAARTWPGHADLDLITTSGTKRYIDRLRLVDDDGGWMIDDTQSAVE